MTRRIIKSNIVGLKKEGIFVGDMSHNICRDDLIPKKYITPGINEKTFVNLKSVVDSPCKTNVEMALKLIENGPQKLKPIIQDDTDDIGNGNNFMKLCFSAPHIALNHLEKFPKEIETILTQENNCGQNVFEVACVTCPAISKKMIKLYPDTLRPILSHKDKNARNAFLNACMWQPEVVTLMCKKFPEELEKIITHEDVDGRNALIYICLFCPTNVLTTVINQFPNEARLLLDQLDTFGWNAFLYALTNKKTNNAKCLIECCKDKIASMINYEDKNSETALSIACDVTPPMAVQIILNFSDIISWHKKNVTALGNLFNNSKNDTFMGATELDALFFNIPPHVLFDISTNYIKDNTTKKNIAPWVATMQKTLNVP